MKGKAMKGKFIQAFDEIRFSPCPDEDEYRFEFLRDGKILAWMSVGKFRIGDTAVLPQMEAEFTARLV